MPVNNIIVPLPPMCSELNLQENVRNNWLLNRVFTPYTNIADHCCFARNRLIEQAWNIMSIGQCDWAKGV